MLIDDQMIQAYKDFCNEREGINPHTFPFPRFAAIYQLGKKAVIDKVMSYTDDTTALYIKSQLNTGQ
jgi:hypothetical protein